MLGELVEHAVDGRDADPAPLAAQPVEDLLRAQAAVLAAEQVDDRAPGAAAPAVGLERSERLLAPGAERPPCVHGFDHSENQYR